MSDGKSKLSIDSKLVLDTLKDQMGKTVEFFHADDKDSPEHATYVLISTDRYPQPVRTSELQKWDDFEFKAVAVYQALAEKAGVKHFEFNGFGLGGEATKSITFKIKSTVAPEHPEKDVEEFNKKMIAVENEIMADPIKLAALTARANMLYENPAPMIKSWKKEDEKTQQKELKEQAARIKYDGEDPEPKAPAGAKPAGAIYRN